LEQIADPGSVFISGKVYDEVRGKVPYPFEDRGDQHAKNIDRPIRVYALGGKHDPNSAFRSSARALPLPDRPSIAVLPFTNMSGDPEQEYFADGVVEEIITALSRVRWFFVIARNSSFTYKGKAVDIRQVGHELGVRYVLEGSVRKAGNRVRITGQLIEAATGRHVWADRFEGNLSNIFDLQDQITENVVTAIEPSVRNIEIERAKGKATDSLDAYDCYLRSLPEFYSYSEQGYRAAQVLLTKAVSRDPSYADAWGALADCIGKQILSGWVDDREAAKAAAREAAAKAVQVDPDNGGAIAYAAWTYASVLGNTEKGVELANRALQIHPNSANVSMQCGWVFLQGGEIERSLELFHRARRISPLDPRSYTTMCGIAAALYFSRRFEDAVEWAERATEQAPTFSVGLRFLAAALAQTGRMEEARAAIVRLREVQPTSSLTLSRSSAYRRPEMLELYLDGLRKAGLPE
jgi:adenylate cyclase